MVKRSRRHPHGGRRFRRAAGTAGSSCRNALENRAAQRLQPTPRAPSVRRFGCGGGWPPHAPSPPDLAHVSGYELGLRANQEHRTAPGSAPGDRAAAAYRAGAARHQVMATLRADGHGADTAQASLLLPRRCSQLLAPAHTPIVRHHLLKLSRGLIGSAHAIQGSPSR